MQFNSLVYIANIATSRGLHQLANIMFRFWRHEMPVRLSPGSRAIDFLP
ncbi:MAG: hypothetical protein GY806_16240 [Gammaproteobacteria bacterium]|nr:hypothetical protein [Gammaproteobacteria bacterium]